MLSVLMTVYEKEQAAFFRESLQSICDQTLPADEVVLVKDGLLTSQLEIVISDFSRKLPLNVISLSKAGRCQALRVGVQACSGDLIAVMDSDDICLPQRFMVQTQALQSHSDVDALGASIAEFTANPACRHAVRRLPREHRQILTYSKRRNPINQVTVMFRREAVLNAGNYRRSPGFEDWHLWNRMMLRGSRFMNLDDVLVLVRVGNGMLKRRSGLHYVKHEIAFHREMYEAKFLSAGEILRNLMVRVPVRLAPERVIRTIYLRALRSAS